MWHNDYVFIASKQPRFDAIMTLLLHHMSVESSCRCCESKYNFLKSRRRLILQGYCACGARLFGYLRIILSSFHGVNSTVIIVANENCRSERTPQRACGGGRGFLRAPIRQRMQFEDGNLQCWPEHDQMETAKTMRIHAMNDTYSKYIFVLEKAVHDKQHRLFVLLPVDACKCVVNTMPTILSYEFTTYAVKFRCDLFFYLIFIKTYLTRMTHQPEAVLHAALTYTTTQILPYTALILLHSGCFVRYIAEGRDLLLRQYVFF